MSPSPEVEVEIDVAVHHIRQNTAGAPLVIFAAGVLAAIVLVGLVGMVFDSIVRADMFLVGFALASLGLAYAIKRYRTARHGK
jgi:putative exporter of polyketide antibiotics